ncbi:hypothetical protein HELRODRAFT_169391 [Helobdella robusta]|uniref:Uncharacterized protein n=1 Tax=Helobdella robusta TaxID=6412 RepID=T1F1W1_HELRO|nr:hypothetical protein HELRODRAFT_169391 [Helobdella robusta]ESO08530.1 hypothetical protein HELRODRAFT_169391 [Helobdella robusta]
MIRNVCAERTKRVEQSPRVKFFKRYERCKLERKQPELFVLLALLQAVVVVVETSNLNNGSCPIELKLDRCRYMEVIACNMSKIPGDYRDSKYPKSSTKFRQKEFCKNLQNQSEVADDITRQVERVQRKVKDNYKATCLMFTLQCFDASMVHQRSSERDVQRVFNKKQ